MTDTPLPQATPRPALARTTELARATAALERGRWLLFSWDAGPESVALAEARRALVEAATAALEALGHASLEQTDLSPAMAHRLGPVLDLDRDLPEALARGDLERLAEVVEGWVQRGLGRRSSTLRWTLGALAAGALVLLLLVVGGPLAHRGDLAYGRRWTASSSIRKDLPSTGRIGEPIPLYLFHTKFEEQPWALIDLGAQRRIAEVSIVNRLDCCMERAIPLVVEVGADTQRWTEVARQTHPFVAWSAAFTPVEARYVRVRVARLSMLHLKSIQVFGP